MALRPCKECKKEISDDAKVCPHCGKTQTSNSGCGCGCLTLIVVLLLIALIGHSFDSPSTNKGSSGQSVSSAPTPKIDSKQLAISQTKLSYHWRKDGFGSIMIADFVVKNDSAFTYKDFEIKCTHYAKSGTQIDSNTQTIYDIVRAHSSKSFPETNMGFIHTQAAQSSCEMTDLKIIE